MTVLSVPGLAGFVEFLSAVSYNSRVLEDIKLLKNLIGGVMFFK